MTPLPQTRAVLEDAIAAHVFPGAVVDVHGDRDAHGAIALGHLSYDAESPAVTSDTIYDLASLTKVLCTTTLAAALVEEGRFALDDPVDRWSPAWQGEDRRAVTIRHLLEHSSGLPDTRPYYRHCHGRDAFEAAIGREPLVYAPGTQSIYSDAGFMLLGFIIERAGTSPLDERFRAWRDAHLPGIELDFTPPAAWLPRIAPTEYDSWRGRLLRGEVHDENAAALDGVAGHAGLFGTAAAVSRVARWWLQAVREEGLHAAWFRKGMVAGSSRALGWDTMLPTSSCGTRLSAAAVGHTGFTGTSLWIDPATGRSMVLLTNRVHPSRAGDGISRVRRAVHDAISGDFGRL